MLIWLCAQVWAAPVAVQGVIAGTDGAPMTGSATVEVRLFDHASDTSADWSATTTVAFQEGAFSLLLDGASTALLAAPDLTVALVVGGVESERAAVGWAARAVFAAEAGSAATAGSATSAAGLSCAGCVTDTQLGATGVAAGTYSLATVTVDADGRVTGASSGTPPQTGVVLASASGLSGSGTATQPLTLGTSGVSAGTYAAPTITVDGFGRITAATAATPPDFEGVRRDCTASGSAGTQTFTGGVWSACTALSGTAGQPARSCLEVKTNRPNAPTGTYAIDPDAAGTTFGTINVHCDMVSEGGGWTLCYAADNTLVPTSTVTGWHTRSNTGAYKGAEYARNCQAMTAALGNLASTAKAVYRDYNFEASGQTTTLIGLESPPPPLSNGTYIEFDEYQGPQPIGIEINNAANPSRGHCFDESPEDNSWGRAGSSQSCWLDTSTTGWYNNLVAVEYWLR